MVRLLDLVRPVFNCPFGGERFIELVESDSQWDVLCHHAADVANYKSPAFDVLAAVENNCRDVNQILKLLTARDCFRIVFTGSVFEPGEGAGSNGLPAISAYGLSKALTAQMLVFYGRLHGLKIGKFVIPNPFGPYEDPRFTAYLIRSWFEHNTPTVNTPEYVRDNIHVTLLAKAYREFVECLSSGPGYCQTHPSGYIESQGAFASRFAQQMHVRLNIACPVEICRQTSFDEPHVRINIDPVVRRGIDWDECRAWDEIAEFYQNLLLPIASSSPCP